ncbi:MAG TPA: pyruvate kinase [Actinomycetota bacterium]
MRATKLICTLGPATAELGPELVAAGLDVARINLSHGTRDEHQRSLESIRRAADEAGRVVAVMADLSGPKVRLGELITEAAELVEGASFVLRGPGEPGDAASAPVSYANLANELEAGDRVLLSDGAVELRVRSVTAGEVTAEVVRGGLIRSRAGLNVPSERLGLPAITPKDERDLEWVSEAAVDLVAMSFVRSAADVTGLRARLGDDGPLIVAKIETGAAVADAERILDAADAVMIARGDLGVEMALEEIPVIQKDLLARAGRRGVPAVVATQMLESMTASPRPTRAEASDVAGAVFDGAAAILLSAETAIGRYPIEAARTAVRIVETAETMGAGFLAAPREDALGVSDARAIAHATATAVGGCAARAVACFTRTGLTARLLSAVRLRVPVYAFSSEERVVRGLAILRGVEPRLSDLPADTDGMIAMMNARLAGDGLADPGDRVVMVASTPVGSARTNLLKVHRVGS